MKLEKKLIKEYFPDINDINQSEPISVLPLTLVDMLLEYRDNINYIKDRMLNTGEIISKYENSGFPVPKEWHEEYHSLCIQYLDLKNK